jgi:predicted GNAT superfamily acetyltransferase
MMVENIHNTLGHRRLTTAGDIVKAVAERPASSGSDWYRQLINPARLMAQAVYYCRVACKPPQRSAAAFHGAIGQLRNVRGPRRAHDGLAD